MKPSNYIYYKDGKAFAKFEHRTMTSPEKNYGTGTTLFWQSYNTGWEAVEGLIDYCKRIGIESIEYLNDDWKQYYEQMDKHVAYMESIRPKQSNYQAIGCTPSFKQAMNDWDMAWSCDAPNKPGYYRANND